MSAELIRTIFAFLIGGFLTFLAVMITRDNFRNRLNRVVGGMLSFAGMGSIFLALGAILRQQVPQTGIPLDDDILYQMQTVWELFFPMLLIFSWIFPEDRLKAFKHAILRYLIFVPPLLHFIIMVFYSNLIGVLELVHVTPDQEGISALILGPLSVVTGYLSVFIGLVRTYEAGIFGLINTFYIVIAIYFLESGRRYQSSPKILSQTRAVLWGLRLSLGLYILAFAGSQLRPDIFGREIETALLLVALSVGAAIFAYATIRYQFLDVQQVFRQSFVYSLTSALLVGAYILTVSQSEKFLTPFFGGQAKIVSYGFIILLLLVFQPINNWIDEVIRTMFIHTRTDHRNVLERFSRQVISQFNPEKLRTIIEETLKTTLLVDRVYFVLFDDEVNEYAVLPSQEYAGRIVLDRQDLMLRGINLLDTPTFMHSLTDYMEDSPLNEILKERKVRLVLPMKDANHLLGFVALTAKAAGYRYSAEDLNLLGVLSNQMVVALTNARLYVDSLERVRLQEEVNMARNIQLGLLPSQPPPLASAKIAASSTPSRTVGGDFYDFVEIGEDRLGVLIADASGKGMPAALMIAQIQAMIRSEVNNGNPISTIMQNMNQQMYLSSDSEKYVTLFYGELDLKSNSFQYTNAGHNYPILARADGSIELLKEGGPIIGALPGMTYTSATIRLNPDDVLFLFTDGLSEAMDEQDVEFGEDRIRELVTRLRKEDPDHIMKQIIIDVQKHDPSDPPQDDTTVITLKMNSAKENGNE